MSEVALSILLVCGIVAVWAYGMAVLIDLALVRWDARWRKRWGRRDQRWTGPPPVGYHVPSHERTPEGKAEDAQP